MLVGSLEVESGEVAAGGHLAFTQKNSVGSARCLLENSLFRIQTVSVLVNVAQVNGFADAQRSGIGFFLTSNHAEKSGFAGAVGPDDADYATTRQIEI